MLKTFIHTLSFIHLFFSITQHFDWHLFLIVYDTPDQLTVFPVRCLNCLDRLIVIKQLWKKKIFERLLSFMVIFMYTLHLNACVQNRDSTSHHPPHPPHPPQMIPSSSFCHLVRHPLFSCFQDSILISLPDFVSTLSILFKSNLCLGWYFVYSTSYN